MLLDARHRVLSLRLVSVGGLQSAPVHPREVFGPALRHAAAAVVLVHNHPSGDPTPSEADIAMTREVKHALATVDIDSVGNIGTVQDSLEFDSDELDLLKFDWEDVQQVIELCAVDREI